MGSIASFCSCKRCVRDDGIICSLPCGGFYFDYFRMVHFLLLTSIVFWVMIICTLATDSWMILRLGMGSKCYIGLFSYDCPKLGISGDFDKDSKCYSYSSGTAVAQIFGFVALTIVTGFVILLEMIYFCKWKILKRKTIHMASFILSTFAWLCMLISACIYTGMAWDECFSIFTAFQNDVQKDPGYSFVATWLIWTIMLFILPCFAILDFYKSQSKKRSKNKKKKGGRMHDEL